jgi:hypothetical protein
MEKVDPVEEYGRKESSLPAAGLEGVVSAVILGDGEVRIAGLVSRDRLLPRREVPVDDVKLVLSCGVPLRDEGPPSAVELFTESASILVLWAITSSSTPSPTTLSSGLGGGMTIFPFMSSSVRP